MILFKYSAKLNSKAAEHSGGGSNGGSSGPVAVWQPKGAAIPASTSGQLDGLAATAARREAPLGRLRPIMHAAAGSWGPRAPVQNLPLWPRSPNSRAQTEAGWRRRASPAALSCRPCLSPSPREGLPRGQREKWAGCSRMRLTSSAAHDGPAGFRGASSRHCLRPRSKQTLLQAIGELPALPCPSCSRPSMALAAAPCSALTQQPASTSSRSAASRSSGAAVAGSRPARQRTARLRVQAVAAPAAAMKTFQAPLSGEQLKEFTSRPRIDFSKILDTVRHRCRNASDASSAPCRCPSGG